MIEDEILKENDLKEGEILKKVEVDL